jgi:hypothetical protein
MNLHSVDHILWCGVRYIYPHVRVPSMGCSSSNT